MKNFLSVERTEQNQKVAIFTSEGAYHGSSTNTLPQKIEVVNPFVFPKIKHTFSNQCSIVKNLNVPTEEEIKSDSVTFVWAFFEDALNVAGPLTHRVLCEMRPFLKRDKKFVYVDSKIQFFKKGDLAVDSNLWHIDGTVVLKGTQANRLGYTLLHDLTAKLQLEIEDHYLAYQSSHHCATEWIKGPLQVTIPSCIPSFDILNSLVEASNPRVFSQPAASIISFTDASLHRASPAQKDGWRLWVRVLETDKEISISNQIIECYNTVFRPTYNK